MPDSPTVVVPDPAGAPTVLDRRPRRHACGGPVRHRDQHGFTRPFVSFPLAARSHAGCEDVDLGALDRCACTRVKGGNAGVRRAERPRCRSPLRDAPTVHPGRFATGMVITGLSTGMLMPVQGALIVDVLPRARPRVRQVHGAHRPVRLHPEVDRTGARTGGDRARGADHESAAAMRRIWLAARRRSSAAC
ncbi:Uncharacterised protein [Mycobacteroides abscessus subsp. massiliense]|nr:Uncharacterised protein [Mycobacteroides abscessus subsp. massiliense]